MVSGVTEGGHPVEDRVAVIGLSCRFPGAEDADAFWDNIRAGAIAIRTFERSELAAAGVPAALADLPDYVPAKAVLADADAFDAAFFGISPREASLIDPQQRIFLEQAHAALEDAGYGARAPDLRIGVFAGAAFATFLPWLLSRAPDFATRDASLAGMLGSGGDYLTTRAAFKLGLTGPAVTVQTACSSSLVAVHLAVQALLAGDCDVALAGGVTIRTPQIGGHVHRAGGALSRDAQCRPFDADATGLVNGCGAGVVVLRRLDEALAEGDMIRAVVLGSAINNDGAHKQAFTAPNPAAQEQVIRDALAMAGQPGAAIDYVEAHGTGTRIGDAVETAALAAALGPRERRCVIGSVKANIGHLDAAAGVAGLIKTILAMEHRTLPPQVRFDTPNPDCRFDAIPLEVAREARPWPQGGALPLAGVSSFGFGGTNAHVVLEGVAVREPAEARAPEPVLLCLQGRDEAAVRAIGRRLAGHLRRHPELSLEDVAATLRLGRAPLPWRAIVLATDRDEAGARLADPALVVEHGEAGAGDARGPGAALDDADRAVAAAPIDRAWRRVPLPTYPFARTPVPDPIALHAPAAARTAPLWQAAWHALAAEAPAPALGIEGPILLIHEGCGMVRALGNALARHGRVTLHEAATPIDPAAIPPETHVVYLCAGSGESAAAAAARSIAGGHRAALALGRRVRRFDCVGAGLFDVLGGDVSCAGGAALHALLLVLRQERRAAGGRTIDLDPWAGARGGLVEAARRGAAAIVAADAPPIVALRGRRRFARDFLPAEAPEAARFVRPGGAYVLIGGAGGVGMALARHLAGIDGVRLALMGRSLDEAAHAPLAAAIGIDPDRLRAIALDVAQPASVGRALADVMREFGGLDGIFHLAGADVPGLHEALDPADLKHALAAKAIGAEALVAALPVIDVDDAPRFLAILSSLTATLGNPGQSLYAAANAAAEAIGAAAQGGDVRIVTLALDRVARIGLADGARGAALTVDMAAHGWIAREHRSGGRGFLPGSAALDLFLAAIPGAGWRVLEDVALLRPVALEAARPSRLWVRADGETLALFGDEDDGRQPLARARRAAGAAGDPAPRDLAALRARCAAPVAVMRDIDGVELGPRWHGPLAVAGGDGEWRVEAALADAARGDDFPGPLHPALLDVAISAAVGAAGCAGFVPVRYARVAAAPAAAPADRVVSHIRLRTVTPDRVVFDVDVMTGDGAPLLLVQGYELVRAALSAGEPAAARRTDRLEALGVALDGPAAAAAICAAVECEPHGQLWATRGDLAAAAIAVDALDRGARAAAPASGDALAAVTAAMADVLGEKTVDADDDFFALGGDSIVALDLVSRLNETGRWDRALSADDLYGAPRPRALAALLEAGPVPGAPAASGGSGVADVELDETALADVIQRFAAANEARP